MPPTRELHPTLARAVERLAAVDIRPACAEPAPPQLLHAIEQFNHGEFFEQHETLEALWLATPGEIRYLFQGILQIGVGLLHLTRRNHHGAVVKLDNGVRLLEPFPATCHGVDVARLRGDAARVLAHVESLGPDRLADFDPTLIPHIHLVRTHHTTQ